MPNSLRMSRLVAAGAAATLGALAAIAGPTPVTAAITGDLAGPAGATAPAMRTGDTLATDPNGCGFRVGLFRDSLDDTELELVLHRFDGNVLDDPRITLPAELGPTAQVIRSADCTTAIVYDPYSIGDFESFGLRYATVDLRTGAAVLDVIPEREFLRPPWMLAPATDGRALTWEDLGANSEVVVIDALTGEELNRWEGSSVQGNPSAFSDDGSVLAIMNRYALDAGELTLQWFGPGDSVTVSEINGFPGRNYRVDLSPDAELAIVEGPTPGSFLTQVVDRDGNVVLELRDERSILHATFVSNDEIAFCRLDGAYRLTLDGQETLIEAFPEPTLQEFPDFFPALFSVEYGACIEALASPGVDQIQAQVGT